MKEKVKALYEELKGTRTVDGELTIEGFEQEHYDDLFQYLVQELSPYFNGDYYRWYGTWCIRYYRFKKSQSRNYDFYCPQFTHKPEEQTTREMLAVIKYFLYRRANAKFKAKEEN